VRTYRVEEVARVGGFWSEVRGDTKVETYLKYVDKCEGTPFSPHPHPRYKKSCYREMERDPETREWVLRYRFEK
jgi:hypothetical protein